MACRMSNAQVHRSALGARERLSFGSWFWPEVSVTHCAFQRGARHITQTSQAAWAFTERND